MEIFFPIRSSEPVKIERMKDLTRNSAIRQDSQNFIFECNIYCKIINS